MTHPKICCNFIDRNFYIVYITVYTKSPVHCIVYCISSIRGLNVRRSLGACKKIYFKNISKAFQKHFKNISKTFPKHFKNISKTFQKHFKKIPKKISKTFQKQK